MRSSDDSVAPIIIKRKKIINSSTHHGGAWKVAYADFVTAMMAFFMLMWLLNATTEKQRKGLADYFSPTISINRTIGGGREMSGGESVLANESMPHKGTGMTSFQTIKSLGIQGISGLQSGAQNSKAEQSRLKRVQDKFMGQTGESSIDDRILKHVIARITDVGLIIDIYDQANSALFDELKFPTNTLKYLLDLFIEAAPLVTNDIAIETHVSASPIVLQNPQEWKTSFERASVVRLYLEQQGLDPKRIKRLTGHADRSPIAGNPMAKRNSRISLILLRKNMP